MGLVAVVIRYSSFGGFELSDAQDTLGIRLDGYEKRGDFFGQSRAILLLDAILV